jgi:hypothetical protein
MSLIFDAPISALKRFARFIEHCPLTGCVFWRGATTCGQGKSVKYGSFWFDGRSWYAHRWAAKFIHGEDIDGQEVDHGCCRPLCVHHLKAMPPTINRELQWIRVQVGIEENPRPTAEDDPGAVPFYVEPDWYREIKALAA